jgi:DNA-binding MarR family transcriptional regulator
MKEGAKSGADELDRVIHEPVRLAILTHLASSRGGTAAFTELRDSLSLTAGNLSIQLKKLEESGYLSISKSFRGQKPYTEASISVKGERALSAYVERMEGLIKALKKKIG